MLGQKGPPPRPRADSTKDAPVKPRAIPDSALALSVDSAGTDSALTKIPPRDTVKTAIVSSYAPNNTEIGGRDYHWTRDELFASGAVTLGDLLAQVPGVTGYQTGFMAAPQVVTWYGNAGSVRVFVDGVAYVSLNPRNGGVPDFAVIPLWTLEDIRIERSAGEVRAYLRTWRVDRTTPSTRVDVITGSENLNLYRGFFGKRFDNGLAVQLAGQQLSTISRTGLDGDALGGFARIGWARGEWSVDGTYQTQGLNRNTGQRYTRPSSLVPLQPKAMPAYSGSDGIGYLRIGWRDPARDVAWVQLIAATLASVEAHGKSTSTISVTDTVDTASSRSQYTLSAGTNWRGIRLVAINRFERMYGAPIMTKTGVGESAVTKSRRTMKSFFAPGVRLEYEYKFATLGAVFDRSSDSTDHQDVFLRAAPFSWLQFGGAWSNVAPTDKNDPRKSYVTTRYEAALKFRDRWITVGSIQRGLMTLAAPIELDSALHPMLDDKVAGLTASVHGPLFGGWGIDFDAIKWKTTSGWRPQNEARTTIKFASGFPKRFTRNEFHLLVSATHELRSASFVPSGKLLTGQSLASYSIFSTLLEIRIGDATISWQYRNAVGTPYEQYPGYTMPRLTNIYGVRWNFWN